MKRHAFTLIEFLVSVTIIGVLLSITLVGLGSFREASRRASCQNNHRQLGISLHGYVNSIHGYVPFHNLGQAAMPRNPSSAGNLEPSFVGPWFQLAPHLEIEEFRRTVVFGRNTDTFHDVRKIPGVLRCPSDSVAGCNYRACGGSGLVIGPYRTSLRSALWHDTANGLVTFGIAPKHVNELKDGLSNTAFASERLVFETGAAAKGEVAFEAYIIPEDYIVNGAPYDIFIDFVESNWPALRKLPSTGDAWHGIGLTTTAYNHVVTPNHAVAIVVLGGYASAYGIVGPSSHHPGGVNLCRADGSVAFVSDEIDGIVWSALASIAGSD